MQNTQQPNKKRITFISFMESDPWGGSEELWHRVAVLALTKGYDVSTLTKYWNPFPQKITDIQAKGGRPFFYKQPAGNRVIRNILITLGIRKRRSWHPIFHSDYFVFSCGTTFDFVQTRDIMKELMALNKPYIIINQHNFENGNIVHERFAQFALDVCNNAQRIYFVSERNGQVAQRQIAYRLPNTTVISNPINIKQPGIIPMKQVATLKLACVARLNCAFKGQDILLEALNSDQWKQRDFELRFYGHGPHNEYLKRLIAMYQLEDKVFIEGFVKNIETIWIENHALVLPSISEGTSLALMEASLCGRPSAVTDVGGSTAYVLHGVTGFVAPSVSPKGLDECLQLLWDNRPKLTALGIAAYEHAVSITNLTPENEIMDIIEQF